jgi:tetratricopeptide (TPR) repeat protein
MQMRGAGFVGLFVMLSWPVTAHAWQPVQAGATTSRTSQATLTWDQMLVEMSRLKAAGNDAELIRLLERFLQTNPKRYEPYVALAQLLEKQGQFAAAADTMRNGRKAVPDMPAMFVLQLIQYDVQQVTESPALPRTAAARLLAEAVAVADELIAAKREVRLALMAKSLALKLKAERVEQTTAGKQAVMAESDRLAETARFTSADGSPIAKTVEDEWRDGLGAAFVGSAPAASQGPALEKFVAAHPDFLPARLSLGRHYKSLGDAIKDPGAKSAEARARHFEAADVQITRAVALADNPTDAADALRERIDLLGPDRLNRPAEAETLARSALAKYPDQPMLLFSLASLLLPAGKPPTDAAVRSLREAAPATPEAQFALGTYLWEMVSKNKNLPRASAAKLLGDATASLDAALKMRPNYMEAIVYKSIVLRLQAERVEQDPARIKALQAEADRLAEQAKQLRSGRLN